MPTYIYGCDNGHSKEITALFADIERHVVLCDDCDLVMHRIPQPFMVNWNGLPPNKADARPPIVKQFINSAAERRARYLDTERKK